MAGSEFIAAAEAAEKVGAQVVLGDRPVDITLQRCWDAFSWRRRLQLMGTLLVAGTGALVSPPSPATIQEEVEATKLSVESISQRMAEQLPEVMLPLVYERDLYLSWSMKRSKAVNGKKRVVAIVGIGHLRGIMHAMVNDVGGTLRFRDLVGGKNTRKHKEEQRQKVVLNLVRDTVLFAGAAWLWNLWNQ